MERNYLWKESTRLIGAGDRLAPRFETLAGRAKQGTKKGVTLRNALLALLSSGPMTGYDVAKRLLSVGFLWYASNSQIYSRTAQA